MNNTKGAGTWPVFLVDVCDVMATTKSPSMIVEVLWVSSSFYTKAFLAFSLSFNVFCIFWYFPYIHSSWRKKLSFQLQGMASPGLSTWRPGRRWEVPLATQPSCARTLIGGGMDIVHWTRIIILCIFDTWIVRWQGLINCGYAATT